MTTDEGLRAVLVRALVADGYTLRSGPDGYALDHLLSAVWGVIDRTAAKELTAAANEVREQHGAASLAATWIDANAASFLALAKYHGGY